MPNETWEEISQQKHAWERIRDKAANTVKFAQNQIDGLDRIVLREEDNE